MTPTEIRDLSEQVEGVTMSPEILFCFILSIVLILAPVFLLPSLGLTNIGSRNEDEHSLSADFLVFLIFFLLLCGALSACYANDLKTELEFRTYNEAKTKWEETYTIPYIKDLPFETREALSVSTREEKGGITAYTGSISPYAKGYTRFTSERHPLVVTYIENTMEEKVASEMEIALDAKAGEPPYIEFQILKEDLGFYWEKGFYNMVLHIHKDEERPYDFRR